MYTWVIKTSSSLGYSKLLNKKDTVAGIFCRKTDRCKLNI